MIEGNNLILEHPPQEGRFMYAGHNYPRFVDIPPHLIDASDEFGIERAEFAEIRVMNILKNRTDVLTNVIRHNFKSADDNMGHDLTAFLTEGSDVEFVHIQVKSDGFEVREYKRYLKNKYFAGKENGDQLVQKWLTDNKIILINGSETKTTQEILNDSFYPQLERIQRNASRGKNMESPGQLIIFPAAEEIQIFPEAA